MFRRTFKIALLTLQTFWMLVVLPGHVRGMIVLGGDGPVCQAADVPSCCSEKASPTKRGETPSRERQSRCAVCYQAHGYAVPPVYDFDLTPTGICEQLRSIAPTRLHQLLCRPTYFANGPPALAPHA